MALLLPWWPAAARTLQVGAGAEFAEPGQAAAAAQAGDTIRIGPGTYYDCAVWKADALVIAGAGAEATRLTDTTCQGKAIMVLDGSAITVRDLTLARARVPDGNGAGIRAEAAGLTVQRVRFEDDQDGLLAADAPDGVLRIEDCVFTGDSVTMARRATTDLLVGRWARLEVSGTRFSGGAGQSAIGSDAALTRIADTRIEVGSGQGASVQASGGLIVENSDLVAGLGPNSHHAAVLALPAAGEAPLLLRGNTLRGDGTLLLNWSGRPATLAANTLDGAATEESSDGAWRFRLHRLLRAAYDTARQTAGALHWRMLRWLHG